MRIACLQFAPQVGDVNNNLNRADAVLSKANPKNLDLLVLPELCFSGYNFRSLKHITPYLEPTTAGITSLWARTTALKYGCYVTAGYPEKVDVTTKWPAGPEYYNSAVTVNKEGETIANYRKSFLYYTDETWALEGPDGFYSGAVEGLGNVAMGICKWPTKSFERMDLNPYKFEAPWHAWEFSHHVLRVQANLVILSMAWLTREDPRPYSQHPKEPDMDTLAYWLSRLEPVIRAEAVGEIIVVLANRCGVEEEAVYAGTSAVLGINGGEVKVYGILGRGEKELLVVDTSKKPQAKLVSEPISAASSVETATSDNTAASNDTACTTPDVEEFKGDFDDVNPISPIDGNSPEAYFSSGRNAAAEPLKSSVESPGFDTSSECSPRFRRPESPKSRNASRGPSRGRSRVRKPDPHEPVLSSPELASKLQKESSSGLKSPEPEEPALPAHDLASGLQNRSYSESPSPQEPALSSHVLTSKIQKAQYSGVKSTESEESALPSHHLASGLQNKSHSDSKSPAPQEIAFSADDLASELQDTTHMKSKSPIPQETALASHGLEKELKNKPRSESKLSNSHFSLNSLPQSQSPAPDEFKSMFNSNDLGPRSRHTSPRPKSTIW